MASLAGELRVPLISDFAFRASHFAGLLSKGAGAMGLSKPVS